MPVAGALDWSCAASWSFSFLVPRMYFWMAERDVEAAGTARFVLNSPVSNEFLRQKRLDFLLNLYILNVVLPREGGLPRRGWPWSGCSCHRGWHGMSTWTTWSRTRWTRRWSWTTTRSCTRPTWWRRVAWMTPTKNTRGLTWSAWFSRKCFRHRSPWPLLGPWDGRQASVITCKRCCTS